jgi:hypothetical protein
VDKVGLGQAFLRVIRFLPVNIIPPWLSMLVHHLEDKQEDLRWPQFMNLENQGGMISTGELLIRPPELSGNPKSSRLVASQEEFGEGNDEFSLPSIFVHASRVIFACRKILRHGDDGFTSPPKETVLRNFIALKKPIASAGSEPANLSPTASTLTNIPPMRLKRYYFTRCCAHP